MPLGSVDVGYDVRLAFVTTYDVMLLVAGVLSYLVRRPYPIDALQR